MRDTARQTPTESMEIGVPAPPVEGRYKAELAIDIARPQEVLASLAGGAVTAAAAKRQARRVALVYGAAASVFALILVIVFHRFVGGFNPTGSLDRVILLHALWFAIFFMIFSTPAVLAATYVVRKQVRYLALAVLALLTVLSVWTNYGLGFAYSVLLVWCLLCAAPTAIGLLLATRRLRAVGPVVIVGTAVWSATSFAFMVGGFLYVGDFIGVHFVRPDLQELSLPAALQKYALDAYQGSLDEWLHAISVMGSWSKEDFTLEHPEREDAGRYLAVATMLISFNVGGLAAWAAVSRLASRYRRRRASDQMLTIDVMVLVFALFVISIFLGGAAGGSASEGGSGPGIALAITLLSIMAYFAYKLIAVAGLRLLGKLQPSAPARTLLLLRVFGFARRTQRLLDDLGQRWRYLGPIRLIAGPDLAYATVEPHEFYDFLSGRLARAFVKDRADLESRLSQEAAAAAPDGLFPVEDFFCHDDTWKMTVSRLARDADAVFMDLRGFSPSNRGCIFEIEQLIAWVPLDRIVLLVDKTTDVPLLERTLAAAWQCIPADSPNLALEKPVVRMLQASKNHWRTLNALLSMLCAPFDSAVRGRPSEPMPA